jgi:hypothetical protein
MPLDVDGKISLVRISYGHKQKKQPQLLDVEQKLVNSIAILKLEKPLLNY